MKNSENIQRKLIDCYNKLDSLEQITRGENVILTNQGIEYVKRKLDLVKKDIRDYEEKILFIEKMKLK